MNELVAIAVALTFHQPVTPKGFEPEAADDFRTREVTIGMAAGAVTKSPEELAALYAVIDAESSFDRWVHAGLVHPDRRLHQDHFKARCLVQAHANKRYAPDLEALGGVDLEATTRCLTAGIRMLRSAAFMCTHGSMLTVEDMERVFAGYANSGVNCMPTKGSKLRAKNWVSIRARVWGAS